MQLTLVDAGDLKAISRGLRHHADGKRLRAELILELKDAARPHVPRVQSAWRSAPAFAGRRSRGRRAQPDLRELLAQATWLQARLTGKEAGVRVRSDGRKMPDQMKALPGYAEGIRRRPWRHPVYGDRETWRTQQPFPRFYDAVQPDELAARRQVVAAVDKVFDQIERAR
jgi:hypothetical protein